MIKRVALYKDDDQDYIYIIIIIDRVYQQTLITLLSHPFTAKKVATDKATYTTHTHI